MNYDLKVDVQDGAVYFVSDVFGRIPVPPEFAESVQRMDAEFQDMVGKAKAALAEGDPALADDLVSEMERRWGSGQTQIRSLRWQVYEGSLGFEE